MRRGKILGSISRQKGNGVTYQEFAALTDKEFWPKIVSSVWSEYEKILVREKAFDFDDLLLHSAELLEKHPTVL